MSDLISSVVAVLGTLAGAALTYAFAERTRSRDRIAGRQEASRQERLAAYSGFIAALTDFRRAQYDRWHRRRDDPGGPAEDRARQEAYRQSVISRTALAMVELTARRGIDEPVLEAAWAAFEKADHIDEAANRQDVTARGEDAKGALRQFVGAANAAVH